MHDQPKKQSVVIIGAGLAGLTAADQILKNNHNVKVTILQAMSQPGGRTKSIQLKGATFDLGAQWIGKPQKYAIQLAERAGSEKLQQPHHGGKMLQLGNKIQTYTSNIPRNVGLFALLHMQLMMWKIDRLAKTVPLQNPRECPHAMQWDSMTAHTWIQQNVWFQKIRKLFQLSIRSVIGCETNEVSFLFFLWYVHHNHGLDCLVNIQNGLQQTKFKDGTQSLSFYLQKQIKSREGKINYNSFVNKVYQGQKGVTVTTRNGQKLKCDYLIIAAPPPAVRNICFQPQLSRQRRFICNKYSMGGYSKMIALYDKQYWKDGGYSGQILSDCHNGPLLMAFDDSRPKQNGQIQPAIVVFFAASIDEQWTNDQQSCKKIVTQQLASYYKRQQFLNPIAVQIKVWNKEESIGGAPTAYTPPGVLTKINNIRQPQGLIHWAGTQTARISQGYMDGAIQSGIRVSKQIISRLNNDEILQKKSEVSHSKWYTKISSYKKTSWLSKFIWY